MTWMFGMFGMLRMFRMSCMFLSMKWRGNAVIFRTNWVVRCRGWSKRREQNSRPKVTIFYSKITQNITKMGAWGGQKTELFPRRGPKEARKGKKAKIVKRYHPFLPKKASQGTPRDLPEGPKIEKSRKSAPTVDFFADGLLGPLFHRLFIKKGTENQWKIQTFFGETNVEAKGHSKGGICRKHCKIYMILLYL